jgi:hypothetical protein
MSSALASPSTGGAAKATTSAPSCVPTMAEREERGLTRTCMEAPAGCSTIARSDKVTEQDGSVSAAPAVEVLRTRKSALGLDVRPICRCGVLVAGSVHGAADDRGDQLQCAKSEGRR